MSGRDDSPAPGSKAGIEPFQLACQRECGVDYFELVWPRPVSAAES